MEKSLKILKEKKRKYVLNKLLKVPPRIKEKENIIEIFFARWPRKVFLEQIKNQIKNFFGNKKIEIKIDENLMGGLRIKTKNLLVKGSLKDSLEKIKCQFLKN